MAAGSAEVEAGARRRAAETREAFKGSSGRRLMLPLAAKEIGDSWHFTWKQTAKQTVMALMLGKLFRC